MLVLVGGGGVISLEKGWLPGADLYICQEFITLQNVTVYGNAVGDRRQYINIFSKLDDEW